MERGAVAMGLVQAPAQLGPCWDLTCRGGAVYLLR